MPVLTPRQLSGLCNMLTYCRPHGSLTENLFREKYLSDLPSIREDTHGNLIVDVGTSRVIWSAHTDTTHYKEGSQTLHVDTARQTISLSRKARKRSSCLGGDDTVGCFIMREMILAGVPGRYIFHYGEEAGCIGSSDLAQFSPETLDGYQFAIALDRAGTSDVVMTQCGDTCISDAFLASMIGELYRASHGELVFQGAHGVYTDTAQYVDLVPECTNLSVGYSGQHSNRETVDYGHIAILLDALCHLDQSALVSARDPFAEKLAKAEAIQRMRERFSTGAYDARGYRPEVYRQALPADDSTGDYETCGYCDLPVIDPEEDPHLWISTRDRCTCLEGEIIDRGDNLSPDDQKFMRYLLGLD